MPEKDDFLYPRSTYRGEVKPENLVFNANQEFAQKVSFICNLETMARWHRSMLTNKSKLCISSSGRAKRN